MGIKQQTYHRCDFITGYEFTPTGGLKPVRCMNNGVPVKGEYGRHYCQSHLKAKVVVQHHVLRHE